MPGDLHLIRCQSVRLVDHINTKRSSQMLLNIYTDQMHEISLQMLGVILAVYCSSISEITAAQSPSQMEMLMRSIILRSL